MRIVISADLHYSPRYHANFTSFAAWVKAQRPDCFILAGDIGHPLRFFCRGLELFQDLPCARLLLPGNHDVYRSEVGSRDLLETWLPHAGRERGYLWLEDEVYLHNGVGICGTMAWYDYSSAAAHLGLSHNGYRTLKGLVNHDADYIDWPWSDRTVARYLARRFMDRLTALAAQPGVRHIVIATHMPLFRQAIPEYRESDVWNLLQAYMGNLTLGAQVRQQAKVTDVVSGHIHRGGDWMLDGPHGPLHVHAIASAKGAPQAVVLDI